jgi:DNA-binding XRE family transcriptional regulator
MTVQIITTPQGERLVVMPESEWLAIQEALEDREDLASIDEFQRKLAAGEEEFIPSEMLDRLLAGESTIRVWREHRGMTAAALATKADISAAYLSELESGKKSGSIAALKRIAGALSLTVDDLI